VFLAARHPVILPHGHIVVLPVAHSRTGFALPFHPHYIVTGTSRALAGVPADVGDTLTRPCESVVVTVRRDRTFG
jgi:hypothetical protein